MRKEVELALEEERLEVEKDRGKNIYREKTVG